MFIAESWFYTILRPQSVGLTVLILSIVAATGLTFGSVRMRGISLGIGGVLFAGLLMGQLMGAHSFHPEVMEFVRDFGLILFVYAIGVQVGPGFFASLRKRGLPLNLLAAAIVLLGVLTTILLAKIGGLKMSDAVGLYAGGTTNTPSLAAASQALTEMKGQDSAGTVAAYAIAYPFGIVGIILAMVLARIVFKVNLADESRLLTAEDPPRPPLARKSLLVSNPNLDGIPLRHIPGLDRGEVVISRVMHGNEITVAQAGTIIHQGDTLLAVGSPKRIKELRLIVGTESDQDLTDSPCPAPLKCPRWLH